ncbi:MAG: hypothetical protein NTZ17_22395 [Phycisphaerae bacterium]|nr:hypothetical protein [Phycisphaerae bacterium]
MRRFNLATLVLVCLSITHAQADLTNPGFETGSLLPWYNARDLYGLIESWNVTSADAHSGGYSATNVGNGELRQDFAGIPVGQIVELSYWLKEPQMASTAFDFFYSDGSGDERIFPLSTSDWEFFDVTSQLSPGKELVGFSVWGFYSGSGSESRTYLDDVTLRTVPVPVPAAGILGGLGLGAASWMLRRKDAVRPTAE